MTFGSKVTEHELCVLIFSITLYETFQILRRIKRNIIHAHTYSCTVPVVLVRFELNLNSLDRFSKIYIYIYIYIYQISLKSVQWQQSYSLRRTVGQTNTAKLIVFFSPPAILQTQGKMSCSCRESNNTNWNIDVGCPAPNSAPTCWKNVWSMSLVLQHYVQPNLNVMAHGDARVGKWGGNWRLKSVASTPHTTASSLHTTSEHGVSSITTADAHTSAASSRLNWRSRRFKWTRPFRRKTKSGFCACAITFQTQLQRGALTVPFRNIGPIRPPTRVLGPKPSATLAG